MITYSSLDVPGPTPYALHRHKVSNTGFLWKAGLLCPHWTLTPTSSHNSQFMVLALSSCLMQLACGFVSASYPMVKKKGLNLDTINSLLCPLPFLFKCIMWAASKMLHIYSISVVVVKHSRAESTSQREGISTFPKTFMQDLKETIL